MPLNDPIMAVVDRLPMTSAVARPSGDVAPVIPFAAKHAVVPCHEMAKHEKSYYTVQVQETTTIINDGTKTEVQDTVERERED